MAYTTIDKGSKYFNTVLYTGNGVGGTNITGVGFQPDLVWIKRRSATEFHVWNDAVRGVPKNIYSNSTNSEDSGNLMSAIISDGFTVQTDGSVNFSGSTYVAWNWLGANTTVSNTSGTITSTVSANTTAGFSIVSYTGTGSAATVGHGLGVAPKIVIIKNRNSATNWSFYSKALVDRTGNSASTLVLNNAAADGFDASYFNSTAPTSTVFSIGSNSGVTGSGNSIISYCFAEIKGYSKFGSYTGNGSTDGTFVYTGFKPAYVMIKNSSSGVEEWGIWDSKRDTYNLASKRLVANIDAAENSADYLDFVSNGFKIRTAAAGLNGSGNTLIYMAFAENPFVTSGGIPVTAR